MKLKIYSAIVITVFFIYATPNISNAQSVIDEPIYQQNSTKTIYDAEWHPSGQILAVATDQGARIYSTNLQELTVINFDSVIYSVSWNPQGTRLAITHGDNIEIWNWDESNQMLSIEATIIGTETQISVNWSPNGFVIASISIQSPYNVPNLTLGTIHIWNTSSWTLNGVMPNRYLIDTTYSTSDLLDWNASGSLISIVGNSAELTNENEIRVTSDLAIFIFDSNSLVETQSFQIGIPNAFSIAWQPTGDLVVVGSEIGVSVIALSTEEIITTYPSANTDTLDWSTDGRYVIANVSVIDIVSGVILGSYASSYDLSVVRFNPNGDSIFSAGVNGELRVENPALLSAYSLMPLPPSHSSTPTPTPTSAH